MENEMVARVWQHWGIPIRYAPGLFELKEGRFSFTTKDGEQFNIPVSELKGQKWPWLMMGLGFNMELNGKKWKFTFMEPRDKIIDIDNYIVSKENFDYSFIEQKYGEDWWNRIYGKESNLKTIARSWRKVLGG